jgi:hypothetical protein
MNRTQSSVIRPLNTKFNTVEDQLSPIKQESPRLYQNRQLLRSSGADSASPNNLQLLRNMTPKTLASLSTSSTQPASDRGKRLYYGSDTQLSPSTTLPLYKRFTVPRQQESDDDHDDFDDSLPKAKLKFAELGSKISDLDLEIQQQHKVRTRKMQHVEGLAQKIDTMTSNFNQLSQQVVNNEERTNKLEASEYNTCNVLTL